MSEIIRAMRGILDTSRDRRPYRSRKDAIKEAAYFRWLNRKQKGISGTPEKDYREAELEVDSR